MCSSDLETIANPANYMLQGIDNTIYALDDIGGVVDVIQDGRAVILDLEGCKINGDKVKGLKFGSEKDEAGKYKDDYDIVGVILSGSIQDTAENRVQNYGRLTGFDKDEVTATAEAVDKRTIELTFTHPVTKAGKGDFTATNFTIDSVTPDGTKVVVIKTVSNLTAGIENEKLAIKDKNDIETVLDVKVEKQENIKIVDAINPTLEEAEGTINKSATKLTLTLTFDEELSKDYEALIRRDLTIKRADGESIDMSKADVASTVSGKTVIIVTEQFVKEDTAYEIEITNPSAIRDIEGNTANKTEDAVVAEDIKVVEDEVKPVDKAELDKAIANAVKVVADKEIYTEESYNVFEVALNKAQVVKANEKATKEEVAEAVKALNEAIAGLKEAKEPAKKTVEGEIITIPGVGTTLEIILKDVTKVGKVFVDEKEYAKDVEWFAEEETNSISIPHLTKDNVVKLIIAGEEWEVVIK